MNGLKAISPIDGRYAQKCSELQEVFSEYGLIRRRVIVELAWLKALASEARIRECRLNAAETKIVDQLAAEFGEADAARVKEIERTTNHDVKAVEYFLKERIAAKSLRKSFPPGAIAFSSSSISPARARILTIWPMR